jgi:hypothetical protein
LALSRRHEAGNREVQRGWVFREGVTWWCERHKSDGAPGVEASTDRAMRDKGPPRIRCIRPRYEGRCLLQHPVCPASQIKVILP